MASAMLSVREVLRPREAHGRCALSRLYLLSAAPESTPRSYGTAQYGAHPLPPVPLRRHLGPFPGTGTSSCLGPPHAILPPRSVPKPHLCPCARGFQGTDRDSSASASTAPCPSLVSLSRGAEEGPVLLLPSIIDWRPKDPRVSLPIRHTPALRSFCFCTGNFFIIFFLVRGDWVPFDVPKPSSRQVPLPPLPSGKPSHPLHHREWCSSITAWDVCPPSPPSLCMLSPPRLVSGAIYFVWLRFVSHS
jgi:hypothetical protein|mmetsp:Transcript_63805/g.105328  ORF Transcript_63805/g.105328 Transcript_63805/m.105328 type:complete len:247 (-) Transcript_63805:676-1416(-)